jgi:DNA polymerase type B, organellar and viral
LTSLNKETAVRVDAVWDIETEDWDTFVVGSLWTEDCGVEIYRNEDDFAEALLSLPQGYNAWAHAGGRFDVLWLLDWCKRNGRIPAAQIRLSGSSIASLAIRKGPVFRDSNRLMPMSLAQASTMFEGERKEKLELPCRCGRDCGGYCSITRGMTGKERERVEAYLVKDIESLRDTLVNLNEYCASHSLVMSGTVASTAWNTAKVSCGIWDTSWDSRAYRFARLGYYGGRTEVGRTVAERVYRYDRVSAYPAALSLDVPTGEMRLVYDRRIAKRVWSLQRQGFYRVSIDVPEQIAPPLPIRLDNRLAYPWGKISGVWSRDEILRAEETGAKILAIEAAIVWEKEEPLLKPHIEHCFSLREKAETKSLKTWLKFIANSLTGAFAQDPEQDVVALGEEYADRQGYEPVGNYDWIWRRKVFRISERAHVQWAGVLTARARIELNRQITHAGDSWCYSDTDSVISTKPLTRNIGDSLGAWKFEGEATQFEAIAPKVYTYMDESAARYARAKGIPDAVREWDRINAGEEIALNRGVKSLLVAARGDKLFQKNDGHRRVSRREQWCGARVRVGERTRAPHVKELPNLPR